MVPREEWPNHRSVGVLVAVDGSQRSGGSGQGESPRAAFETAQEEGNLMYRCLGERRVNGNRSFRYVDLTPVVFGPAGVQGHTRGLLDDHSWKSGRSELSGKIKCCGEEERIWKFSPSEMVG